MIDARPVCLAALLATLIVRPEPISAQADSTIAIGVRAVDAWHHAPEALRPPVPVAVVGLAAVGYLGVRLGATATAVRAARPVPPA